MLGREGAATNQPVQASAAGAEGRLRWVRGARLLKERCGDKRRTKRARGQRAEDRAPTQHK